MSRVAELAGYQTLDRDHQDGSDAPVQAPGIAESRLLHPQGRGRADEAAGGGGAIVLNSSVLSGIAFPGTSIYKREQGGLDALTRAASMEAGRLTADSIKGDAGSNETHPFAPASSIPLGRPGGAARRWPGRNVPAVGPGFLRQGPVAGGGWLSECDPSSGMTCFGPDPMLPAWRSNPAWSSNNEKPE